MFFHFFRLYAPSTEACFANRKDAIINIEKGIVGFGLSAGHETVHQ